MATAPLASATASSLAHQARSVADLVRSCQRLVVLTGAGISTDSGIPDYRSPGRPPHRPTQHHEFMTMEKARIRYWARSMIGYNVVYRAKPNAAHRALAAFDNSGRLHRIITQNVDDLHQRAGSTRVTSLHGSMNVVRCMTCSVQFSRSMVQDALEALNGHLHDSSMPGMAVSQLADLRPDGDIHLPPGVYARFRVPPCWACGGILKPAVVFFGDSLVPETATKAAAAIAEADGLLVVGSSLTVFSAFRLVRLALDHMGANRVAVLNRGPTRPDGVVAPSLRVDAAISPLLAHILSDTVSEDAIAQTLSLDHPAHAHTRGQSMPAPIPD